MASEKVVVSPEEIDRTVPETHASPNVFQPLPSPIPRWAKIVLALLVPLLPLLSVITIILKIAFRTQPSRARNALASYLTTLLPISGLLTTVGIVLVLSFVPVPAIVSTGLADLDERTDFPVLTAGTVLDSAQISGKLKPLVIVVSPVVKLWNHQEIASQSFGAGMLLEANSDGYLFATANHVVAHSPVRDGGSPPHVMVTTAAGIWSTADVIATAASLDISLLWVPRHSGLAKFIQPISQAADGEEVFVIGHPEGLKYTLSTGLVSGLRDQGIQISAAISPGNSGGPVYDRHGALIGIVSSKFDRNRDANAENLGFAARAEMLRSTDQWSFYGTGRKKLDVYLGDLQREQITSPAIDQQLQSNAGSK
jgi:S1-C subfamily serine protease